VTLENHNMQAGQSRSKSPTHIGELVSQIVSFDSLTAPESEKPLKLSGEIRAMLDAGRVGHGLQAAREVYESRKALFSESARITGLALANLLEHATRVRFSLPDLKSSVFALEQHWELPAVGEDREIGSAVSSVDEQLQSPDPDSSYIQRLPTIMHILPRVCEYAAQCGRRDPEMRDLAERSLEHMHIAYPFFDQAYKAARHYAASATIRAATHIASWKIQEDRPDLRALKFIADCGHDRAAQFSPSSASFYHSLFKLESGNLSGGLELLEELTTLSRPEDTDVRIGSLDQLTGWYIRLGYKDKAKVTLSSLQTELERDHSDANSAMRSNERVKWEELARLRSYEKALSCTDSE
jgi:hypothetical protein